MMCAWSPKLDAYLGLKLLFLAAVAVAACDAPGVALIDPVVLDSAGAQQTGVTITVRLEDTTLARALGWEHGVPGAEVTVYRILDEFKLRTAVTDSSGEVPFAMDLPGGHQYRIAAYRALGDEETVHTDGEVRAFGDGLTVWLRPPQAVELKLRVDRAGSLVLSEIRAGGRYGGPGSQWPDYDWFGYFEVYNNSDTTLYMDGMLWGHGFLVNDDAGYPCSETDPFRNDPLGIWAWYFHQFPGNGGEYAVAPGQTVTIALDAVDHSVVHPDLPDLSNADFELEGTADADNPDVPNMPEVGPRHDPTHDHGVVLDCTKGCFLAQAQDVASLVRQRAPFFSSMVDWVRIPAETLLDVVTTDVWAPDYDQWVPCATKVPRYADRLEHPLREVFYDVTISMQRRLLRMAPTGLPVLHDVNVSFLDFVVAPRSPGWIHQ